MPYSGSPVIPGGTLGSSKIEKDGIDLYYARGPSRPHRVVGIVTDKRDGSKLGESLRRDAVAKECRKHDADGSILVNKANTGAAWRLVTVMESRT